MQLKVLNGPWWWFPPVRAMRSVVGVSDKFKCSGPGNVSILQEWRHWRRKVSSIKSQFIRGRLIANTRRLLYVACTRAQSLLYALYSRKRQVAGQTKSKTLSEFISAVREKDDVCAIMSLSGQIRLTVHQGTLQSWCPSIFTQRSSRHIARLEQTNSGRERSATQNFWTVSLPNGHITWLHIQNFREDAGDKVRPMYRQANGGFCTMSLTGERNVLESPRK